MYKFKWTGYFDPFKWELYWYAAGCSDLVVDFHHAHLEKEGPHQSFQTPEDWELLIVVLI